MYTYIHVHVHIHIIIGGDTFPDNTFPDKESVDLGQMLGRFGGGLGSILARFWVDLGSVLG